MPAASGKSWKMERASVSIKGRKRPRSNKYRENDGPRPATGSRERVWIGGYSRDDGTKVKGHYRSI